MIEARVDGLELRLGRCQKELASVLAARAAAAAEAVAAEERATSAEERATSAEERMRNAELVARAAVGEAAGLRTAEQARAGTAAQLRAVTGTRTWRLRCVLLRLPGLAGLARATRRRATRGDAPQPPERGPHS